MNEIPPNAGGHFEGGLRMTMYILRSDGIDEVIEAETMEVAREEAEYWVLGGGYDASEGTVWVDTQIVSTDGEVLETVTTTVNPSEPKCIPGWTHEWAAPHWLVGGIECNPGVWGHGGGVIIREACLRCGCQRTTDTWAQRRDTGEQGLTSISYARHVYDVPRFDRIIDEDDITTAERERACEPAVTWLREAARTVGDLYAQDVKWYEWAMNEIWLPSLER
jgi:hypothetical protein